MYVFNADTYCDACGERLRRVIEQRPVWAESDSDAYPQHVSAEHATADYPVHCASDADCLEAVDLGEYGLAPRAKLYGAESRMIGALLSDGLTEEGIRYTRELMREPQSVTYSRGIGSGATHVRTLTPYQVALHAYWREVFADELA